MATPVICDSRDVALQKSGLGRKRPAPFPYGKLAISPIAKLR
jgi:hypothetical protein